jgi:hypothetical protein
MNFATKIAALTAAIAIPALASAGTASAEIVDQYDNVKYVFCADTAAGNDVSYYDAYGSREKVNVRLEESVGGTRHCGSTGYTETDEYGDFVASSISNDGAPYVYCAIYVNGQLVSASEDYSDYGYAFAYC